MMNIAVCDDDDDGDGYDTAHEDKGRTVRADIEMVTRLYKG